MKKFALKSACLLAIASPFVAVSPTASAYTGIALRTVTRPQSYYIHNKLFVLRSVSKTRSHTEYREGVRYSGTLHLTHYQKDSDGNYLAYYSGTIRR